MKNIIITTYTLLAISMLSTSNPTFAGDRVIVYDMAESNVSIEFPMKTSGEVVPEAVVEIKLPDELKM